MVAKLTDHRSCGWYTPPNGASLATKVRVMIDTIKMRRPDFRRRQNGRSGRVEHDSKGNAVWKRTRATDSPELPDTAGIALVEEPRSPADGTKKPNSVKNRSKEK